MSGAAMIGVRTIGASLTALFGIEARYIAKTYALRILLVAGAIMAVVLAIDLATNFDRLAGLAGESAPPEGAIRWLVYAGLRAAYNLPAVLPIAGAIGIISAEYALAMGQERAAIFDTGRSRLVSLWPALVVGLAMGFATQAALSHLRPQAVTVLGEYGLRSYGARYAKPNPAARWFATDTAVLRGRLVYADGVPHLSGITAFALTDDKRIRAIVRAQSGHVTDDRLVLDAPVIWQEQAGDAPAIPLNGDWLANFGVDPRLLPDDVLHRIASAPAGVADQARYRAAWADRQAGAAKPWALCLLAAGLCLIWMRPRMGARVPLGIAVASYGFYALSDALATLAEFGAITASWAAWGPSLVVAVAVVASLGAGEWRISRRLAQGAGQ